MTEATPATPADRAKHAAAAAALQLVEDGMVLGLGTGSTAWWLVELLAERMRAEGLQVTAVATSTRTAEQARAHGIPMARLDEVERVDLTIDGADEVDPALTLIKGGGGALLQEKIVAASSGRMVVIADASKQVAQLGAFPLPVEVVRFGHKHTERLVRGLLGRSDVGGDRTMLRHGPGGAYVTDEGHHILDLHLGRIGEPDKLDAELNRLPGVVETGLFVGMAERAILGREDGGVDVLSR